MPLSDRLEVGMSSWETFSELVIVTCLATGTLSFSQVMSGKGEACKKNINSKLE